MKKFLAIVLVSLVFLSCKKEDGGTSPIAPPITTIDGFYSYLSAVGGFSRSGRIKSCNIDGSNYLHIQGAAGDNSNTIELKMLMPSNSITVGAYSTQNASNFFKIDITGGATLSANASTVEHVNFYVTEVSDILNGKSYKFTCEGEVLSDGMFPSAYAFNNGNIRATVITK